MFRYRLIPALAGKTYRRFRPIEQGEAHPRAGGENLARTYRQRLRPWLIPALAGKTRLSRLRMRRTKAHPRAGGENQLITMPVDWAGGSSPRWRGKLIMGIASFAFCGLIPALAGKTGRVFIHSSMVSAHPRAGGENITLASQTFLPIWLIPALAGKTEVLQVISAALAGSSPRWRGKPNRVRRLWLQARLIPALAGKTLSDLRFYRADRSDLGNP